MRDWLTLTQRLWGRRGTRFSLGGALVAGFALLWTTAGNAAPDVGQDRLHYRVGASVRRH